MLPLGGHGRPLLRETYERASSVGDEVFVLTETRQREIIEAVLPEIDAEHLILEPSARGTTNAYGLAALTLMWAGGPKPGSRCAGRCEPRPRRAPS